jgi:phosphate starvation-inducible PhoH-like protein
VVSRVTFPPGPSLSLIFGFHEENLRELESSFGVRIVARGNQAVIKGPRLAVEAAQRFLEQARDSGDVLSPGLVRVSGAGRATSGKRGKEPAAASAPAAFIHTPRQRIVPRGPRQAAYVRAILDCGIVFGVGPAGTGKTYLAVGCAIAALLDRKVDRIILVRPVVEAGERLGFLPGGVEEKVNPYMRPLHDALTGMLDVHGFRRLLEQGTIEMAPLAYMRGRTLDRAFVILDEAQNTSIEQMKMFLTRLGTGSQAVVTGDITQIDLPKNTTSGLVHALSILRDVEGTAVVRFLPADVVRHELVQRILERYEEATRRGRREDSEE